MSIKRHKEANENLKRAKKALQVAENKLKAAFEEQGKKGRRDEIARKKAVQDLRTRDLPVPETML